VPSPTGAREELAGPIPAEIVAVIDGDTVKLRAHIWLGQEVETSVRLAGINAPELRGDCDAERRLAAAARDYLAVLLTGATVSLRDIAYDKYGGRVVAQVTDSAGHDLGAVLVAAGYARPYDGGQRAAWC
jgi:endonuclease YncB( thermonuclease family)